MSDHELPESEPEIFLLPEEIITDEKFARPSWGEGDDGELALIEALARTIERDGQMDAGILVPRSDGKLVLLAGHRRKKAISFLNEGRARSAQPLLKMRLRIDRQGGDLYQKSVVSNFQRRGYSPMEQASIFQRLRKEHGWEGMRGTRKIASYVGVTWVQVQEIESLFELPREAQDKLHGGTLTVQAALMLLKVKPEFRAQTLERATELHEASERTLSRNAINKRRADKKPAVNKRIGRVPMAKALQEKPERVSSLPYLKRSELLRLIKQFDTAEYKSRVRLWVKSFLAVAAGRSSADIMRDRFQYMVRDGYLATRQENADE